jgi:RNA polymerase sigma factor (TIGR02999 family)
LHPKLPFMMKAWSGGDPDALERLAEQVYPELRLMARRYMKSERLGNTLQATALVHEVYLRLVEVTKIEFRERAQFFAMAAQMMRRILVKRGARPGCTKTRRQDAKSNHRRDRRVVPGAGPVDHGAGRGPDRVLADRSATGEASSNCAISVALPRRRS